MNKDIKELVETISQKGYVVTVRRVKPSAFGLGRKARKSIQKLVERGETHAVISLQNGQHVWGITGYLAKVGTVAKARAKRWNKKVEPLKP